MLERGNAQTSVKICVIRGNIKSYKQDKCKSAWQPNASG